MAAAALVAAGSPELDEVIERDIDAKVGARREEEAGGETPDIDDVDTLAEDDLGISQRGFKIELTNMLPVPPEHLGYDQILDFKHKRLDELQQLRDALDDIYRRVADARDIPDAKAREVERLLDSVENVRQVMNERRWPFTIGALGVEVSLGEVWQVGVGVAQILLGAGTKYYGMVATGVASMIKVTPKKTQSPELRVGAYKYIYHAAQERNVSLAAPMQSTTAQPEATARPVQQQSSGDKQ